ncbi:exostosin-like 3 [Anneissia japonica]|uniref:exostosin-like 3 n=1 Tax=Anneissia japonica TaxID=1529436 RepID=UPI001425821A|nr:exostosin-like 3 [Anneissia japonica]XP_033121611.1 exostosin-like 3 [Anneissia japonica]
MLVNRMEFAARKEPSTMRPSAQLSFARWLSRNKFLSRLITILLVILIVLPLLTHYYLTNSDAISYGPFSLTSCDSVVSLEPSDLKTHLEELCRIRISVSNELREMENRRQSMNAEMNALYEEKESMHSVLQHSRTELESLRLQVKNMRKEKEEVALQAISHIVAPKRILPDLADNVEIAPPGSSKRCRQYNCFDYSRCSVTSHFPVYFYKPTSHAISESMDPTIRTSLMHVMAINPYIAFDADMACVFVVAMGDTTGVNGLDIASKLESSLHKLKYWNGDGRNHVLLNLQRHESLSNNFKNINTGRAMIIQTNFEIDQFRAGFDIVAPMLLNLVSKFDWTETPSQVPARRTFFLTFQGRRFANVAPAEDTIAFVNLEQNAGNGKQVKSDLTLTHEEAEEILFITEELEKLKNINEDKFYIDFICKKSNFGSQEIQNVEWGLCGDHTDRAAILQQSTFALILANNDSVAFSTHLYKRLYEALRYGAIPVILGEQTQLPFGEFISWKKCVIILPKSRITELYFFLKTFSDKDILAMRRQGWFVWSTYLSSTEAITDAILATLRTRISIPASILPSEPSPNVFPSGSPKKQEIIRMAVDPEELLGPLEPPLASPKYLRNFTTTIMDQEHIWNNPPGPEYLFPFLPNDPLVPTDARFIGSEQGFRPVGGGAGGAGKEFQEEIGGNVPREQFTIVMLTYEREKVLMTALERLVGLPYLNKVVVVWNSPEPPSDDLLWPQIHVPIKVIKTKKNSLNNRFLPYDEIDTEAILSIDDDAHLRHDEMLFGFRVWREARDRIVGFPGRFHAWDLVNKDGFLYNSNYSCELSMVLTGAAFFHKYYSYVYSYIMPKVIRDKVDEYMNCEDIAMNFLVSHITRKPPIKVTSRWTFRCPGCPDALSLEDSHFNERHKCIQFFTKVFGYTPLLNTQFRVDSVLFKTRIPHDKQKCFKYI